MTGPGTTLRLVAANGVTVASATFSLPAFSPNIGLPWTSASLTRACYLDSLNNEIHYLAPDGSTGLATTLTVGQTQQVGFAVSPDDKRIAVSVLSYTPPPSGPGVGAPTYKGMVMYVQDLVGGGHRVQIFSSSTVAEYPIGWTGGHLVIAVGTPVCCQAQPVNPYGATSYHVADASTGARLATLCPGSFGPEGPVEPIGTMCFEQQGGPIYQRWDGRPFPVPTAAPNPQQYLIALSPDGTRVAVGGATIRILQGGQPDDVLSVGGNVWGWLDASHLVIEQPSTVPEISVVDLQTGVNTSLGGATQYLGTFPAPIS